MEPTQLKAVEYFRGLGLHKEVVERQPGLCSAPGFLGLASHLCP